MGENEFHTFLSHYKVEAATEARWLQERGEMALGGGKTLRAASIGRHSRDTAAGLASEEARLGPSRP